MTLYDIARMVSAGLGVVGVSIIVLVLTHRVGEPKVKR